MHPSTCRPPRGPRQPPAAPCPPRPPSRGSPLSCPVLRRVPGLDSFHGRGTRRLSGESGTAAGEDYDITRISWEHCVISGDERRLCAHQLQISAELTRRSCSSRGPPGGCGQVEMVKRRQTECMRAVSAVSAVPTVSSSGSELITQIRVCSR